VKYLTEQNMSFGKNHIAENNTPWPGSHVSYHVVQKELFTI